MEQEASAAKRAFPGEASKIDRLALRDENFADLCRDFDLAVAERQSWEISEAPERDERLSEYSTLVEELKVEMQRALASADVVRLRIGDAAKRSGTKVK